MNYRYLITLFIVLGCKPDKKYHDQVQNKILVSSTKAIEDILEFQSTLNETFKNPNTSPLPDRYRKNFESLDFFPPDTTYIIKAKFVRTPEALPFYMPTTTSRKSKEIVYGIAYFTLKGEKQQLEIYKNQELALDQKNTELLFLPFTDETNDDETYGGGRYIDLSIPNGNFITIDFNKAYNPYCAYNKKYSCPLVPDVNTITTKILAGVKAFKKAKK